MLSKIREQLAGFAALIGVVCAIGAGFVKYGEMNEKMSKISGINVGAMEKEIAILQKSVKYLELEIKELKADSKNPLSRM
jgi:hypothetical protein